MPSNKDLASSYEFALVGAADKPFVGYISSQDKTNVSERALVKGSKNMFRKQSGTWSARDGLKRRGIPDATLAPIASSYVWNTSLGKTIPLRVVNYGGSSSKLQFESDIVTNGTPIWYDLLIGLSLTRFVFDTWWDNTLKKDRLLFVKGDSTITAWSGAYGLIVSTTSNTIVLNADAALLGFDSSGDTINIDGHTYTYTGVSGSTLTGVSTDPTGEAAGNMVVQAVDSSSNSPTAGFSSDFIKVINNQLYVGSYISRLVYISKNTSYTDFTQSSPRIPGDGELITLDAPGKGIGQRQGKAHIFAGTSYLHVVTFTQITVGTTLTEQTSAPRQDLADLEGALAHEFIDTVGDSLVYLSQENQVTVYGTFRNLNSPRYPCLSLAIRDELKAEDFTGGQLKCSDEFIYMTAPISGISYLHETNQDIDSQGNITANRYWHTPHIWNIQSVVIIDGVKYGHSNANPQIYQLQNTGQWHDDGPSQTDLVTNGSFNGNADGWTLDPGWAYGSNNVIKS